MKRNYLLGVLVITFNCNLFSQTYTRPGDWKKLRKEIFITGGGANFLGDLGGRDRAGTDYSPVDLEFALTKTAFGIGYRYKLLKQLNFTSKFSYLKVKGDDKKTKDIYRNNRNLNFQSNIFELSARLEFGFESGHHGNRYGIKKTFGRRIKSNTSSFFFFAGIGGFYFNPKPIGGGVSLQQMHTEGQGLPGGAKPYSRYSVSFPLGFFYKYTIDKKFSIGIEFSLRKTLTDYIDDVSTVYYDKQLLTNAYGPVAAAYADPSLGNIPGATEPSADGTRAQRGDLQKDSYMTVELTIGYVIKEQRKRARLRSKF